MRSDFSLFALFTAGLSAVVSAYTTPVGEPSGNPITEPGLGEIVDAGEPYTITWTPTTPGFVTLLLLRGPSNNVLPLYPIVENTPNTGTYEWTPAADLEDDITGYGIQLIVDSSGQYQYSTQFGISNPGVEDGPEPSGRPSGNSTISSSAPIPSSSASLNSSSSAAPSGNGTTSAPETSTTVQSTVRTTPPPTNTRSGAAPSASTGAAVKGYVAGAGSALLAVVGAMIAL